jgi:hypothetical protein
MDDYGKFSPDNMKKGPRRADPGSTDGARNDAVADKKQRAEPKKVLWGGMEAVEKIAAGLIREHHPELASARFKYICRDKAAKKHGEKVRGKAYKMSRMYEYLVGCDFVIEVALEKWNDLSERQRTALVDHLLSHCVGTEDERTGDMKWSVRPPEIQEFPEVAERHGQWNEGLVEMGRCLR